MDWKEALLAQSKQMGIEPTPEAPEASAAPDEAEDNAYLKQRINIVMEKKGRGGKTATIIEGFTCSPARLAEIARSLKQHLGTGGSARGGEILVQGDRRADCAAFLKKLGFTNVKGGK